MKTIILAFLLVVSVSGLPAQAQEQASDLHRRELLSPLPASTNGKVKVAFFDADSTLRVSKSGSVSANGPEDYIILPGAAEKIAELHQQGFFILIISNQAGVPRYVSLADADKALFNMIKDFAQLKAVIHYYDFAETEATGDKNDDRKPGIGMALRLQKKLTEFYGVPVEIDKSQSIMVGDSAYKSSETRPDGRQGFNFSNSDRLFAENYGIKFLEPQYFFGWIRYGVEKIDKKADLERFTVGKCTIKAPRHRDLAVGKNKEALCTDVIASLEKVKNYFIKFPLVLTVTDQAAYSVSMRYVFDTGAGKVSGEGIEYWNPDGREFVVTK